MNKLHNSIFILLILTAPIISWAQTSQLDKLENISLEEIEGDILLNDALISQERDERTGISLKSFSTAKDQGRYSFLYHLNSDLIDLTGISSFEVIYAKRYSWGWLEYSFARTSAKINQITEYNTNIGAISEDLFLDTHTISEFGLGVSYRSKYIQNLIQAESLFETIAASFEYVNFTESTSGDNFSGIGLKADFGIHIRSSKNLHYGIKLSNHLASVKKPQEQDGQDDSQRALLLSWISLGLDMSFYY